MNPLLLGGAALVALLAMSSSSSAAASQSQMVFKDYTWTTTLPATMPAPTGQNVPALIAAANAGQWPAPHPLAVELPAPPNTSATGGRWMHYPLGCQKTSSNAVLSVFPGCPGTVDVYAWMPNFNWKASQPNVLPITNINGYTVTNVPWMVTSMSSSSPSAAGHVTWGPSNGMPPPPPGVGAGVWKMIHPGYCVWLTAANSNSGELADVAFNFGSPLAPAAMPVGTTPAPSSSFLSSL